MQKNIKDTKIKFLKKVKEFDKYLTRKKIKILILGMKEGIQLDSTDKR